MRGGEQRRPYRRGERRRRLRLVCCALARLLWDRLVDGEREAIEVAEAFADDRSGRAGRAADREAMWWAFHEPSGYRNHPLTPAERKHERRRHFRVLARAANASNGWLDAASNLATHNYEYGFAVDLQYDPESGTGGGHEWIARLGEAWANSVNVIRDVFRCPVEPARPPWPAPPNVREWAEGVYASRSFDELPVLADAVEEAGCDDLALLAHLRNGLAHHRGCWAIDALRGPPFDGSPVGGR